MGGADAGSFLAARNLLVIAPHPDDESYGCAGTIAKAKALGARVHVMVISVPDRLEHSRKEEREVEGATRVAELEAAMRTLGVDDHCVVFHGDAAHMRLDAMPRIELVRQIERASRLSIEAVRPDVLLIPAPSLNQDHEAVHLAAMAACRPHLRSDKAFVPAVLSYDQPQLGWGTGRFVPSFYVDISDHLAAKLAACGCHRSQLRPDPHLGSLANVERLARLRGSEIAVHAAEAFHCHRLVA